MDSDLYRIAYCSRNEIRGTSEEVAGALFDLLEAARAKNRDLQITGALISQAGVFAQVLEGPQHAVEQIYGLVQRDDRNSGVTLALSGPQAERNFPKWSMAFADGERPSDHRLLQKAIDAVFAAQAGAGENLLTVLKSAIVHEDNFLL